MAGVGRVWLAATDRRWRWDWQLSFPRRYAVAHCLSQGEGVCGAFDTCVLDLGYHRQGGRETIEPKLGFC